MYEFPAAQQTSIVRLLAFWGIFQTEEDVLRINKSKSTGENTFNVYHFDMKSNHESSKDEIFLFFDIFAYCSVVL